MSAWPGHVVVHQGTMSCIMALVGVIHCSNPSHAAGPLPANSSVALQAYRSPIVVADNAPLAPGMPPEKASESKATDGQNATALVSEAAALLDQYAGDWSLLEQAEAKLRRALVLNPDEASAYVELARFTMKRSSQLDPHTLKQSEELIRRAIAIAPDHGNAFVLLGYVLTHANRLQEADEAFANAREYKADSPWLDVNEAELRESQGQPKLAEEIQLRVASSPSTPIRLRAVALGSLANRYRVTGRYDEAERAYLREIGLVPGEAWPKGNLAELLRVNRLDLVRSEQYAREALAIMNYGMARRSLGFTLYLKWAEAAFLAKDAERADALFAEARRFEPDLSQIVFEVGYYPRPHPILSALKSRGISVDTMPGELSGTTPLNVATAMGNQALAAALIAVGAVPDTLGYKGITSLMMSAMRGNAGMARLLLDAGADPSLLSWDGKDAERYARDESHPEIVDMLVKAKTTFQPRAGGPGTPVPFKVHYAYRVKQEISRQDRSKDLQTGEQVVFWHAQIYGNPSSIHVFLVTLEGKVKELSTYDLSGGAWSDYFDEIGPAPAFKKPS